MLTKSLLQTLSHPIFTKHQISVQIKRDDLIHPQISGNKWRKLKYNIEYAKKQKLAGIVSFGGSYSNHIHALAYACYQQKIKSVAIIRGEASNGENSTLSWAKHWGMELHFVDRKTYRKRDDANYLAQLQQKFPDYFIVPEGGSNTLALPGMAEVINELEQQTQFDTLMVPVGSGGTLAGLITADNSLVQNKQHQLLGIAVLKQPKEHTDYLDKSVRRLLSKKHQQKGNWQILSQYHGGGYAKFKLEDAQRIIDFSQITGVPFEPIYSGKMIIALLDLIEAGYFAKQHRIVLLHTGGLQGLAGLAEQNKITVNEWPSPPEPPVR